MIQYGARIKDGNCIMLRVNFEGVRNFEGATNFTIELERNYTIAQTKKRLESEIPLLREEQTLMTQRRSLADYALLDQVIRWYGNNILIVHQTPEAGIFYNILERAARSSNENKKTYLQLLKTKLDVPESLTNKLYWDFTEIDLLNKSHMTNFISTILMEEYFPNVLAQIVFSYLAFDYAPSELEKIQEVKGNIAVEKLNENKSEQRNNAILYFYDNRIFSRNNINLTPRDLIDLEGFVRMDVLSVKLKDLIIKHKSLLSDHSHCNEMMANTETMFAQAFDSLKKKCIEKAMTTFLIYLKTCSFTLSEKLKKLKLSDAKKSSIAKRFESLVTTPTSAKIKHLTELEQSFNSLVNEFEEGIRSIITRVERKQPRQKIM